MFSALCIYMEAEAFRAVCRDAFRNMDGEVVFLDCVYDVDLLAAFRKDVSGISYLTSHFSIERSALEDELVHCLVLCLHRAVTCELYAFKLGSIISEELDIVAVCELDPVA